MKKWLTKLTVENEDYLQEFYFKSDSKKDADKTFHIITNRYNGLDYSCTHIEDYYGNVIAVLKYVDKIPLKKLSKIDMIPVIVCALALMGIVIWTLTEIYKTW